MAPEEMIVFANLALRLAWQPIKFSGLDKMYVFCRRLLKEQTFVKISAVKQQ